MTKMKITTVFCRATETYIAAVAQTQFRDQLTLLFPAQYADTVKIINSNPQTNFVINGCGSWAFIGFDKLNELHHITINDDLILLNGEYGVRDLNHFTHNSLKVESCDGTFDSSMYVIAEEILPVATNMFAYLTNLQDKIIPGAEAAKLKEQLSLDSRSRDEYHRHQSYITELLTQAGIRFKGKPSYADIKQVLERTVTLATSNPEGPGVKYWTGNVDAQANLEMAED